MNHSRNIQLVHKQIPLKCLSVILKEIIYIYSILIKPNFFESWKLSKYRAPCIEDNFHKQDVVKVVHHSTKPH